MFIRILRVCALVLLVLAAVSPALAQSVPNSITYQGKLTNLSGEPVADGTYQVQFMMYTIETGGSPFWTSAVQNVTASGGVFTTQLQPVTYSDVSGKTDVWLEVWAGSPLAALSPRVKLRSAPFALRAGDLDLPFARSVASASDALSITTTGSGNAGYFQVNNALSSGAALYAATNGSGSAVQGYATGDGNYAGSFEINNANSFGTAVFARTNGSGRAVYGWATGDGDGVAGYAAGYGNAVTGWAAGDGRAVSGYVYGRGTAGWFEIDNIFSTNQAVFGRTNGHGRVAYFASNNASNSSDAVYAYTIGTGNAVYASAPGPGAAVKGETGSTAGYANAVVGRVTSTSPGSWSAGVRGINEGTGGSGIGVYGSQNGSGWGVYGTSVSGSGVKGTVTAAGWAGTFDGGASGNGVSITTAAGKTGLTVFGGTKNAVVATSTGARLLYTEESSEVWFTDYGFGRLENGRANITIDPAFAETVSLDEPYHVFAQLNDLDSSGVGVINKTAASFEVGELQGGRSNAEFSYRIVARRKNYEKTRLERAPYADDDPNLYPDQRSQSEADSHPSTVKG